MAEGAVEELAARLGASAWGSRLERMQTEGSKEGFYATKARIRAQEAMVDAECGPARMVSTERAIVDEIMSSIFLELGGNRKYIDGLLESTTWAEVYEKVRSESPGLFNALNLATLQLKRPSIVEAPADCAHFTTRNGYLQAWGDWYKSLLGCR